MESPTLDGRGPVRGGYPGPEFFELTGLDRLYGARREEFPYPPITHLVGLAPVDAGVGTATFNMPASPWLCLFDGVFSGGVVALAADGPAAAAITTTLDRWVGLATSELTLNFLRPATPESGTLIARGELIQRTKTLGYASVSVEDTRGRRIAHGTSRCVITPLNPAWVPPELTVGEHLSNVPLTGRPDPPRAIPSDSWMTQPGIDVVTGSVTLDNQPPFAELLGVRVMDAKPGEVVIGGPASEWLCAPERRIYGGVIAALAHEALTGAVYTTHPAGVTQASLDLTVHYLRPALADGRELRAIGTVARRGRTLAVGRAEVVDADDRAIATAVGCVMILEGRGWPGDAIPYDMESHH
jgi:uncharacterized protein (TIGR00369 family)